MLERIKLKQRGRAEIDFMTNVFFGSASLRDVLSIDIEQAAGNIDELPEDLDQRNEFMEKSLSTSKAFRVQQLLGEWHSRNHGPAAVAAFEEVQHDLQAELDCLAQGPSTIEIDENFSPPSYWQGVEFHRTAEWDAHPYMGFVHGEIIHRRMVDNLFPGGIFKQRLAVAEFAPKKSYQRILDMGCSSGHFTHALAKTYPKADITGVDLSPRMLEHAQRMANSEGRSWKLFQRAAENTKFEPNSFDLVTSYILLHEMPEEAIRAMFAEAFRVLQSGGDLLMSDVTRYADLNKLDEWHADRGATYGGEPHWRASASLDLKQVAEEAGFINVSAGGMNDANYPYIVQGRKPE